MDQLDKGPGNPVASQRLAIAETSPTVLTSTIVLNADRRILGKGIGIVSV